MRGCQVFVIVEEQDIYSIWEARHVHPVQQSPTCYRKTMPDHDMDPFEHRRDPQTNTCGVRGIVVELFDFRGMYGSDNTLNTHNTHNTLDTLNTRQQERTSSLTSNKTTSKITPVHSDGPMNSPNNANTYNTIVCRHLHLLHHPILNPHHPLHHLGKLTVVGDDDDRGRFCSHLYELDDVVSTLLVQC